MIGGLFAGVIYSLVAIGFVLIYKASGVFNFAQGSMVLFSALTFVSLNERGLPFWAALILTIGRWPLWPYSPNAWCSVLWSAARRSHSMVTLGLSLAIEGLAEMVWGTQVHGLELGISDDALNFRGLLISQLDFFAGGVAAVLVVGLATLFHWTRLGYVIKRGQGNLQDPARFGSVYYNLGVVNGILNVEAVRVAQGRFGKQPLTGEQVRWGFENLDLDDTRLPRRSRGVRPTATIIFWPALNMGTGGSRRDITSVMVATLRST